MFYLLPCHIYPIIHSIVSISDMPRAIQIPVLSNHNGSTRKHGTRKKKPRNKANTIAGRTRSTL